MTNTEVNGEISPELVTQTKLDTKAPSVPSPLDSALQRVVEQCLRQDSSTKASKISVHVVAGVVTLAGIVDNYLTRQAAEQRAAQLHGVRAVVNTIKVRTHPATPASDEDIEQEGAPDAPDAQQQQDAHLVCAVWQALQRDGTIPLAQLHVTASQGYVFLNGAVEQSAQRTAAERVVRQLAGAQGMEGMEGMGIAGIINWITATPDEIERRITEALAPLAEGAAPSIAVEVQGQTAFLKGTVQSAADRARAEQCALSAPGIRAVRNDLTLSLSPPHE